MSDQSAGAPTDGATLRSAVSKLLSEMTTEEVRALQTRPPKPSSPDRTKARVRKPLFTGADISRILRRYDRTPFIDLLAAFAAVRPDTESFEKFVDAHPDRWAAALRSLGALAGFAEKKEVQATLSGHVTVGELSDSQLEDHLRKLARDMGIPLPPMIELVPLPTTQNQPPGYAAATEDHALIPDSAPRANHSTARK